MSIQWYYPLQKRVLVKYELKAFEFAFGGFINYQWRPRVHLKLIVLNLGFWITL